MEGKKLIAILGAGESGVGAAILASRKGYDVFVSDAGAIKEKYLRQLQDSGIPFEQNGHTEERIISASEVIKSPGIPDKAPLVKKLLQNNIPVISEIEFACRYTNARLVGITGSNGKTTTTLLTYHILKRSGMNVGLGGNVGKSFALQVANEDHDVYILELSSFQLDGMFKSRMNIAVITNITPDHLDRYEYKFENYIKSKLRITNNQQPGDALIYCADDEATTSHLTDLPGRPTLFPFSINEPQRQGAHLTEDQLTITIKNDPFIMNIDELALQGKHNLYNSMAAGIASRLLDIRKEVIRESLADFENIEHRLEFVAKVNGIEFINDSKATNVNSTWYALESMENPVVWIVGGVDKGNDYSMLMELVKKKVKAIVCLGTDNSKLIEAFKDVVPALYEARSAQEAVGLAYRVGKKGDTVLLSPACASFDLFHNYEDRGQQFKAAVKAL